MLRSRSVRRVSVAPSQVDDGAAVEAPPARRARFGRRLNDLDVFFVVNAVLFVAMCAFPYHDRWVRYMGSERTAEFLLYAVVVLAAMVGVRMTLPERPFPAGLLVLCQVWILAGFAGGFVHFAGERLYDHHFLGLRYDKYVHVLAALVLGLINLEMVRVRGLPDTRFLCVAAFFAALGILALWELVEAVFRNQVPAQRTDGSADSMADMWANLAGALLFLGVGRRVHRSFRRPPVRVDEGAT